MKSLTEHLWFEVKGRRGFINITDTVEELVLRSGVNEGIALCNSMRITSSVFIKDNESGATELSPQPPAFISSR